MTIAFASALRRATGAMLLTSVALLTGCGTNVYVDTATRDVPIAQFKKVANPKPVAFAFEFQSRGAPNAQATEFLRAQVQEQVAGSGLFLALGAGGDSARLSVQLNNVPLQGENAVAKGFVTGLTFGMAGNVVTDVYECKLTYLPAGKSTPLVTTARHAIHTALGATDAPANAVKAANMEQAVRTMTREVVANALNELSQQAAFN